MDDATKRKLNILIYLAKVDGKFHKAEKAILLDFVREKGLDENEFHLLEGNKDEPTENITDKAGVMFLALKVMEADGSIDPKEVEFGKDLAKKLGFDPEVIDKFAGKNLTREEFDRALSM